MEIQKTYPQISVLQHTQVVLASGSPRRRELLARLLPEEKFSVLVGNVDERRQPDEEPINYVKRLALVKAEAGAALWLENAAYPYLQKTLVLGADTIVVLNSRLFGKPSNNQEAVDFLRELSGRTHQVITGFAASLLDANGDMIRREVSSTTTEVEFRKISDEEITWYVNTGEPVDKAGAYAVQGFGGTLISAIRGDYYNVVGLPLGPLINLLRLF
jgi:septum formation protein